MLLIFYIQTNIASQVASTLSLKNIKSGYVPFISLLFEFSGETVSP